MNPYYFILEAEPQPENPVIAHASRAVAHIWVMAGVLDDARDKAVNFLESELWEITEEKNSYLLTEEMIDELKGEELSNFQAAQSEGLRAKFYYYHRND